MLQHELSVCTHVDEVLSVKRNTSTASTHQVEGVLLAAFTRQEETAIRIHHYQAISVGIQKRIRFVFL